MAHPQDKEFVAQMGGKKVKDDKSEHLDEERPTFADRMKRAKEDAMEAQMIGNIYGVAPQAGEGGKEPPESIQAAVVTSALTQMNNMVHEANMIAKEKEGELIKARKDADDARAELFTSQLVTIKEMQAGLATATAKATEQGTPEAAMAVIEKYGVMMDKLKPKPPTESVGVVAQGVPDSVTIQLQQMRNEHEMSMAKLLQEQASQGNEFKIRMLEFEEESRRRWAEYSDGRSLKEDAVGGFQDLAAAVSAGISRERGIPTEEEEAVQVSVSSFPCGGCGATVPVTPGATQAVCPGCGTIYGVKHK